MTTVIKKTRNSETRNKIYKYLCGTKAHPSAYMIYHDLRTVIPTLSIGTVYNNLKHFEEQGMIINIYKDTVLVKFPLCCYECKTETKIDVIQFKMELSK